ncbi:hypothetical protein [Vibrio mediterranei]|uniref:hypothetical protein n=1 Tax=Vibrio mediterranei TaxID=689 RepID=UPI001EFDBD5B|nr:hypothetical protein [Vibrio mediterranei]MCG9660978.1 hypothetical protein [Vibrio mediterranei]
MNHSTKDAIEQLAFESNQDKGRIDALSFIARLILDGMKMQDKEAYQSLKTACLEYSHQHVICLGEIGESDIEDQAQAFAEEIEHLFCEIDEEWEEANQFR